PITEHHRDGREHLHRNFSAIHFFDPPFWIPNVVRDFAKDAVADHPPRAAWFVVIKPDESRVAVFRVEIGPIPRKNVGVQVDLHDFNTRKQIRRAKCPSGAQATGLCSNRRGRMWVWRSIFICRASAPTLSCRTKVETSLAISRLKIR